MKERTVSLFFLSWKEWMVSLYAINEWNAQRSVRRRKDESGDLKGKVWRLDG